ncbi:FAD binding domain-containing protein [Colletotrichum incanum]|nr:FAD binding domain-containing protein [Colletotrichum incanum]
MTSALQKTLPNLRKTKVHRRNSWSVTAATILAGLTAQYFLVPSSNTKPVSTIEQCLNDVCAGRSDCVQFPTRPNDMGSSSWMRPFNLDQTSIPTAIIRPQNATEVANVVKCALKHDAKLQAKAGGHSLANHGFGGQNGAISVDLEHFQYTHVEASGPIHNVRVGGGTRLGQMDESLRVHQRAVPHGLCMDIGIGGHATVGGLGPMSRIWGTTLDNIEEMEVVTANGTIVRASNNNNPDLFFAMRGAGSGFGIVTEFVMKTHPTPSAVLHLSQDFVYNDLEEMVNVFHAWQAVVADPALDHRFSTEIVLTPQVVRILSTWYGKQVELHETGILNRLPESGSTKLHEESWDSSLDILASKESLHMPNKASKLHSKSLGFSRNDLLSKVEIAAVFDKLEKQRKATDTWSIKFQAVGGAISEVPTVGTAYAHRDKLMLYQSYSANASKGVKDLLNNFHRALLNAAPRSSGTYPGFADPELRDAQRSYWGANLLALQEIKAMWDPKNVFHNPQSVVSRDYATSSLQQ